MAVVTATAKVTRNSISWIATDDGGGGAAPAITRTAMRALMTAAGIGNGPFFDWLALTHAVNSTAIQRSELMGDASGLASQDLRATPHCTLEVVGRTADGFIVDADVNGTSGEINITGPTAAGIALITLTFVKSLAQ